METIKIKQADGSEKTVILPVRGMVGTLHVGSDRYGVSCKAGISNKKVRLVNIYDITEDNKDQYIYEKDGVEYLTDEAFNKFMRDGELYSLRKNGTWREVGIPTRESCCIVTFSNDNQHIEHDF